MYELKLSGGVCLIDLEDLPKIEGFTWYVDARGYVRANYFKSAEISMSEDSWMGLKEVHV